MSKHILAVGNGNQLTEVTKHGVLLVHKWDARRREYVAHSGDWTGTDGVNAKRGIVVNVGDDFTDKWVADLAELDDMEATQDAAGGRYGY